jgi:hypothetical protein
MKKIHRYYKIGDIVVNKEIWGNKKFIIHGLGGNYYNPELYVHPFGEDRTIGNSCNFPIKEVSLISSYNRPLRKIVKEKLIIMVNKGIEEAKRELIIRNRKEVFYV